MKKEIIQQHSDIGKNIFEHCYSKKINTDIGYIRYKGYHFNMDLTSLSFKAKLRSIING